MSCSKSNIEKVKICAAGSTYYACPYGEEETFLWEAVRYGRKEEHGRYRTDLWNWYRPRYCAG